jgi:hypothetical protein
LTFPPKASTKAQPGGKTPQSAAKSDAHNEQKGSGCQRLATDDSHQNQKPVSAKGTSTFEGAVAGSNVRQGFHIFGTSQPSNNSNHLAEKLNTHVSPTDTAPSIGQDFETESAAWSTRQAELQSPPQDSSAAHTFDQLNDFGAVDNDRASLDFDDDFAYLAAYNAAHPLFEDASFQSAALPNDALLYDGTMEASTHFNAARDQEAFSSHRREVMSFSQSPPSTSYNSSSGAKSSLSAESSSYVHYFQNVNDQTDFSEFMQDHSEGQTASVSAATKRAFQAAHSDDQDQSSVSSRRKRERRNEPSMCEGPDNVSVNSILRGNTARRSSNGRDPRRS